MTSRKEFLVSGALAAAMPAVATAAPSPSPAPSASPLPKLAFDTKSFEAIVNGPQAHKHLFSSVGLENGTIFNMVHNVMTAYDSLAVPRSDVQPVAVLYHGAAVTMGYNDVIWNKYIIPAAQHPPQDPQAKSFLAQFAAVLKPGAQGNPYLVGDTTSIPALVRDANLHLFLCDLFTRGFATGIAKNTGLKTADVYQEIAANLVPNTMLAPNGVWAMHAVQEYRYTVLPVTVTAPS
jgi:hypothetical protein